MSKRITYFSDNNFSDPVSNLFVKNVYLFPANNALYVGNKMYSYKELHSIVINIYKKIPAEKIVNSIGIYCNDDVYTYASILAVNMYGAAYIPLNKKYPVLKNKSYAQQCRVELILTSVVSSDVLSVADGIEVVNTSLQEPEAATVSNTIDYKKTNQPTAYVLFTSGTTGEPKGAPVSHYNLNHFFNSFTSHFSFTQQDKFLQSSELTFDFSVFAFFMPLSVGACCYVVPDNEIRYTKIMEMLLTHNITVVSMVPTILKFVEKYLSEIQLPELKYSFFSGDALYYDVALKWSKTACNGKIYNCYGTTETTIVCSHYLFDKELSAITSVNGIVPLGKPFKEMDVLIVDEKNNITEKGELCFNGPQVIASYLDELPSEKFFNHNGKKYYKPGDIGYYNAEGDLIFSGRKDRQVKINGYRIELGEIEHIIEKTLNKKCVVLCIKDKNQLNKLIAYIESSELDEQILVNKLSEQIPEHMIPQKFILVDKFKLTINGKIDRTTLLTVHS